MYKENGKDIFVLTSMTQDVQRKASPRSDAGRSEVRSEVGSEKDSVFHYA